LTNGRKSCLFRSGTHTAVLALRKIVGNGGMITAEADFKVLLRSTLYFKVVFTTLKLL
jgi:hypothetical protein